MQSLKAISIWSLILFLAACNKTTETASTKLKLILHPKNECTLVFKSERASLVEDFCSTNKKPILITIQGQERTVDWIDEKTSRFLFEEGCVEAERCFYEINKQGNLLAGRFSYSINLTEGEYTFEIDSKGKSMLLSESTKDIPS